MGAGSESSISRFDAEQQKVFEYEVFTTKSSKLPQAELFRVVENAIPSDDGLLEIEDSSEINSDNLFCKPVLWTDSETTGTAFLLQGALWRHRRSGHIWRPTDKKSSSVLNVRKQNKNGNRMLKFECIHMFRGRHYIDSRTIFGDQ
jgi:hypothetical protein